MPAPAHSRLIDRRRWLGTLATTALLSNRGFAADKPDITLRFSHVVTDDTPKGLAARRFKTLVEQRSGSRIAVQIFPDGKLYGDHDEMQALQLGAVDLVAPSLSKFGRIGLPEFELFDLPFLFEDLTAVRRITQGQLGQNCWVVCHGKAWWAWVSLTTASNK